MPRSHFLRELGVTLTGDGRAAITGKTYVTEVRGDGGQTMSPARFSAEVGLEELVDMVTRACISKGRACKDGPLKVRVDFRPSAGMKEVYLS